MTALRTALVVFVLVWLLPIGLSAVRYWWGGTGPGWQTADRSSAGLLPAATGHDGDGGEGGPRAVVRVFAAPTVGWRGIVAVHCWLVWKAAGDGDYTRVDYTAWGDPVRINGFAPDARWFGRVPSVVFAADGAAAASLIPRMAAAVDGYPYRSRGDYRAWPGPNSNTFVAAVLDAVPEAGVSLPPNAIGRSYPYDGRWLRRTPSGTGVQVSLGGYAGLTIGWVEGIGIDIAGGVAGIDIRRPAIMLPGWGRIGMAGGGMAGG